MKRFELSLSLKYIWPRRGQIGSSLVSLLSICVIAIVVWLMLVFFSVTHGLEKSWMEKLVAISAPIRLVPTEAYYQSYYYRSDAYAAAADFSTMNIAKKQAQTRLAYDENTDEALPRNFPPAHDADLVRGAFTAIESLGLSAYPYEHAVAGLHVKLLRFTPSALHRERSVTETNLNQTVYLQNLDKGQKRLQKHLLTPELADLENCFRSLSPDSFSAFFNAVEVEKLTTSPGGWLLPREFLQPDTQLEALKTSLALIIPPSLDAIPELMETYKAYKPERIVITGMHDGDLFLPKGVLLSARVRAESFPFALSPEEVDFDLQLTIQGKTLEGIAPIGSLSFAAAQQTNPLPITGPLFPVDFRQRGALIGDRASITYTKASVLTSVEETIACQIAGFYDPGILPLGGKVIFTDPDIVATIAAATGYADAVFGNGIAVEVDTLSSLSSTVMALQKALINRGIEPYWKIIPYDELDFTKELILQLRSERSLFHLLAILITVVACSNIITWLFIMVRSKRREIALLRAMGAHTVQIIAIFCLCALFVGVLSMLFGTLAAVTTLFFLHPLLDWIGRMQGFPLLSETFYGKDIPNTLDTDSFFFALVVTLSLSLVAGLLPALWAARQEPSQGLRGDV